MKKQDKINKLIKLAKEKITDQSESNKLAEKALALTDEISNEKQKVDLHLIWGHMNGMEYRLMRN